MTVQFAKGVVLAILHMLPLDHCDLLVLVLVLDDIALATRLRPVKFLVSSNCITMQNLVAISHTVCTHPAIFFWGGGRLGPAPLLWRRC